MKEEEDKLSKLILERRELLTRKIDTPGGEYINEIEKKDLEIVKALQSKQMVYFEKELNKLSEVNGKRGMSSAVSTLKESIIGKKKRADGPSAIIDPNTNKLVFKPSEIVRVSADYCVELLTNRSPIEGFENDLKLKRMEHNVRMDSK